MRLVQVNQASIKKWIASKLGEVSEWPKEHAWKVCIRKRIEGSNPSLTATNFKTRERKLSGFFVLGYDKVLREGRGPSIRVRHERSEVHEGACDAGP